MITILDADSLGSDMDLSLFNRLGECTIWPYTSDDALEDRIKDMRVIVTNRVVLTEPVLKKAEKLELIALTATGYNNVDIDACRRLGIHVANVRAYSTESVAQHCFAMLLYLLEKTRYYDDYVRNKGYRTDRRFADVSRPWSEISGKTWGIIGLGAIGRRVAQIAEAFGARPVYYSTSGIKRSEPWPEYSLNRLLEESDIISVHAPLNEKTQGLIGLDEFRRMKKDSIFLNLGRGAVIEEPALYTALQEGSPGYAGLDVMTSEPPADDNPLLTLIGDRLLITPHNAWGSIESRSRLIREVYSNIEGHLKNEQRNLIV